MAKVKYKTPTSGMERMVKSPDLSSRPSIGMTEIKGEIYYLSSDVIIPYKNQARKEFDDESLKELASSIEAHGIIQPLQLIKSRDVNGKFEVISGERRLRAAQMVGLEKVPCMILDQSRDHDEIALIENIQRKDLHPIELADAISMIVGRSNSTQNDIAKQIGMSKQQISHLMAISRLPQDVKEVLLQRKDIGIKNLRNLAYLKSLDQIRQRVFGGGELAPKQISILRLFSNGQDIEVGFNKISNLSPHEKKELKNVLFQLADSL